MYVAAKEPLPTSSEAEANEVIVPLSALGMAKAALYEAMREQGVGRAELAVGYAGTSRKSIACSTCVTPRGWNMWKPRSPLSDCVLSSMWLGRHEASCVGTDR